jgi:MFS superfamily sulfate permease-like transporter
MGVVIGMVAKCFVAGFLGAPLSSMLAKVTAGVKGSDGRQQIVFPRACTFGNLMSFKKVVREAQGQPLSIDFSKTEYIDHTFMHELRSVEAENDVTIVGLERLTPISDHPQAMRRVVSGRVRSAASAS